MKAIVPKKSSNDITRGRKRQMPVPRAHQVSFTFPFGVEIQRKPHVRLWWRLPALQRRTGHPNQTEDRRNGRQVRAGSGPGGGTGDAGAG